MLAEAVAAVDRSIVFRKERNLRLLAAIGADHLVHLTSFAALMIATTLVATVAAARRLVLEALLRIEFLLACAENKFLAAVFANECFVLKSHNSKNSLTLKKITCTVPSTA